MKFKDFVKLTRAEHSIMLALAVIAGEVISGILPSVPIFILALVPPILIGMASFSINDYFDIKVDKENKKMSRPLVSGMISPKGAFNISIVLFVLGVLVSLFVNFYAFVISLIFAFLAFMYSYKMKEILLLGNIYIAFAMAIPFIYGNFIVSNVMNPNIILISAIILLSGLGREVHGMIRDYDGDIKERHIKNVVYYLGKLGSSIFSAVMYFLAIFLSLFMFIYKLPFKMNIIYLVPILFIDIALAYVSVEYILNQNMSPKESNKMRNLSLLAMSMAILIYLISAIFIVTV